MEQNAMPHDRKTEIVTTAAALLEQHGEAGFSMREVAKAVGIKLASLQYHFPNKAELMAAILNHIMDAYLAQIDTAVAAVGDNPRRQLDVAARLLSGVDDIHEGDGRLEMHLWSMSLTDPLVRDTMNDCHRYYLNRVAHMITAANPTLDPQDAQERAVLIASLQEGAMLFTDDKITGLPLKRIREGIYRTTVEIALS